MCAVREASVTRQLIVKMSLYFDSFRLKNCVIKKSMVTILPTNNEFINEIIHGSVNSHLKSIYHPPILLNDVLDPKLTFTGNISKIKFIAKLSSMGSVIRLVITKFVLHFLYQNLKTDVRQ